MGGTEQRSQPRVIIPETGAAKYYYVDPNAPRYPQGAQSNDADQNEQFINLLDTLKRLGFQPNAEQGDYQF